MKYRNNTQQQYNTRNSGKFNTPGTFISTEVFQPQTSAQMQQPPPKPIQSYNTQEYANSQGNLMQINTDNEVEMKTDQEDTKIFPSWMKTKLSGVKKVSNKERRRRQNERLRRQVTAKNPLMVLNEILHNEQTNNQCEVKPVIGPAFGQKQGIVSYCADLVVDGNNYKGYGDNKVSARNAAAEQAVRAILLSRLSAGDQEAFPMTQLVSYALYKLFSEWEAEGHAIPALRPQPEPPAEAPPAKTKQLPLNAADLHPCVLLTYMKPGLEYVDVSIQGDKPQNMQFTVSLNVDGQSFSGSGPNKREARRQAAAAAAVALYGVHAAPGACDNKPQAAPSTA